MKRALIVVLSGLVATAVTGCGKKEAPAGAPPEVYVADVLQKDVPVYMELVGQTRGSQDVEIRARVEGYLNRVAFTEGAFVRKGDAALPDRPAAARGGPRQREGAARDGPGPARQGQDRRQPPDPAREAAGGQPAGARQRALGPGRGPRAGRREQGGGRQGDPRPRVHADHRAARRPRGHDRGQGGQPRRPRREHAAHDGLPDQPDPLPGRHQRGRVPPARQAGPGERPEGRAGVGDRAHPGRRHGSPPRGPRRRHRARGGRDDRDSRRPVHVPEPRPPRPPRAVRPGALRDPDEDGGPPRPPAGGRSSCRTSTASPWWARATRSSSAT